MVAGSRLRMKHFFVVLLPEFFLKTHQQWITPGQGRGLVDDLELLSFEAFGFLQLINFFRMISFDVLLLTCTFLFRSVNVCSFAFGIVSRNLVLARCDSSRSIRKISYAFSPTAYAASKRCCIFEEATFPVERHTRSCCTLLNGSSQ